MIEFKIRAYGRMELAQLYSPELTGIAAYRKKTVLGDGVSHDVPEHNEASHGADALRTLGEALKKGLVSRASGFVSREESGGWLDEDDDWGGGNRSGGFARMD